MKSKPYSILRLAITLMAIGVSSADARPFTNQEGTTIDAKLVSSTDTHAVLKLSKGGKEYSIPIATLSKDDQEYIAGERSAQEAAEQKELEEKSQADSAKNAIAKIVEFVETNKGKQVGNGECWTLANEAYKAAGAERPAGKGGRVWGRVVDWSKEKFEPGDIVEMRDAKFPNGTTGPEHTAVVMEKGTRRGFMTVYHQNWSGSKLVGEIEFDLGDLRSGEVIVYRYE